MASPDFDPEEGQYANFVEVTISCATTGAEIRYTTDGTLPTQSNGTVYTGDPVPVVAFTVFKARAFKDGMTDSDVRSATYAFKAAPPIFSLPSDTYLEPIDVTITCDTVDATIRYTTDGSEPTSSHGVIYDDNPIHLISNTTLMAMAYKSGMTDSGLTSATYAFRVATPVFNPPPGTYIDPVDITIACATVGATIRYTTDESEPTASYGVIYDDNPVHINITTMLKAMAYKSDMSDSALASGIYAINTPPVVSDPLIIGDLIQYETGTISASCMVVDADDDIESVTVDLASIGGSSNQALTKTIDDYWEWSGMVTPLESGDKTVTFTATDELNLTGTAQASITVASGPPVTPSPRTYHAMAYDANQGVTVLFGGKYNDGTDHFYNDTWEWNGTIWISKGTSGPSPRGSHAMAYDDSREVIVLFGGRYYDGSTTYYYGDTWEWNGISWTQVETSGPSPRQFHAMAYDSMRGVTVLFGGSYGGNRYNDTWEWDGVAWTQKSDSGPTPRYGSSMVYDSDRGVIVLYGGYDGSTCGDTWEWNGTAWTQRQVTGPTARWDHKMTYDSGRGLSVLFGGWSSSGNNEDTWEWNGANWSQRTVNGPAARSSHAMAYDSDRGVSVLFGGYTNDYNNETWEWNGTTWIQR